MGAQDMSMPSLYMVTGNQNKAREVARILGMPVEAISLNVSEIQAVDVRKVAAAKAEDAYARVGRPVIVDDTGLFISAMGGLPGALVAWFLELLRPAGILEMMQGREDRQAYAETAIGYHDGSEVHVFCGRVDGAISDRERGDGGFGYDTIFVPEGQDLTFAEMGAAKNLISMRRIALEGLRAHLEKYPLV